MPKLRLAPTLGDPWTTGGSSLEVPTGVPSIVSDVDPTTGIRIDATGIIMTVAGVEVFNIQDNTTPISVSNFTDYETLVVGDDDLPNKKYVDDAITTTSAPLAHTHVEADITDLQSYSLIGHNHDASYAPLVHTHVEADITDLQAYALDASVVKLTGDQVVAGTKTFSSPPVLPSYTFATLPTGTAGAMILVTDDVGGSVPAFFDGAAWRRVTDRAVISDV